MRFITCGICGKPSRGPRCRRHPVTPLARGNAHEPDRQRILARDGYRCQLRLPGCTGRATHVDHIVPRGVGGTDDDSNRRAACAACNLRRGGARRTP
jgi:5-methylcytosine-specific restriction endonuclease McrA